MVRQRPHYAGGDPAAPPGGPAFGRLYRVNARRVSAARLAAHRDHLMAPAGGGKSRAQRT
jgi:hypothetical protein